MKMKLLIVLGLLGVMIVLTSCTATTTYTRRNTLVSDISPANECWQIRQDWLRIANMTNEEICKEINCPERIVTKEVPGPERIITKEVPGPERVVEKEVIKEVPVEKTVIKEVPVEKPVEKKGRSKTNQ